MAFPDLLIHHCTVLRLRAGTNRLGEPNKELTEFETGVPCRVIDARGRERNTERMRETYDVTHEMFIVPGSSKMREDDLITAYSCDDDTIVEAARIVLMRDVFARDPGPHHVEVFLNALRGPQSG